MIRILICITFFQLSLIYCCAQGTSAISVYEKLDTISLYYPAETYDTLNDGLNRYYSSGRRIDKKTSDVCQANARLIDKCRPCVLKIYNANRLITTGVQSGDGRTGFWIEYYPATGKIKTKGNYKKTPTGNCTETICSTEHGEWLYYNQKGRHIKREMYLDGKLISKKVMK